MSRSESTTNMCSGHKMRLCVEHAIGTHPGLVSFTSLTCHFQIRKGLPSTQLQASPSFIECDGRVHEFTEDNSGSIPDFPP